RDYALNTISLRDALPISLRLRQDHDPAHDRGLHRADRGHDRDGRTGLVLADRRAAAGKAADVDDLPELRGVAEHDGRAERRVRADLKRTRLNSMHLVYRM